MAVEFGSRKIWKSIVLKGGFFKCMFDYVWSSFTGLPPDAAEIICPINRCINGREKAGGKCCTGEVVNDSFVVAFAIGFEKVLVGSWMYHNVVWYYSGLLMGDGFIDPRFGSDLFQRNSSS